MDPPPPPDMRAEAVDLDVSFTTGGDGQWIAQTTESNCDGDAAQSGAIGDNQETWLETTVEGSGTARFDRKVSSDGSNSLRFEVDGHYQIVWAGSKGSGTSGAWTVSGSRTHTLRWAHVKDGSEAHSGLSEPGTVL